MIHKFAFKKVYQNVETQEKVEVHTNRIEGAWKHAKDHFRKMSGTKIKQFEGHLAEIIWRTNNRRNVYTAFFDLVKSIYTLRSSAVYRYTTPLFHTMPVEEDWNIQPGTIMNLKIKEYFANIQVIVDID